MLFENEASSVRDGNMVLRYVIRESVKNEKTQQVLIVVPKKRVRLAVNRNKLKRQLREIYRLNKNRQKMVAELDKTLLIAIIYTGRAEAEYGQLEKSYLLALGKMAKEIARIAG